MRPTANLLYPMKRQSTHRTLASLLALGLAACATVPQDTEQYIFLDESETLYVDFRNSADPRLMISMPEVAENMRKLRREDFRVAMAELLELYELPIDVHLLSEFEEPGDGPVLVITALRFEQDNSGDLVAVIRARLSQYGELNTLGTYNERKTGSVMINDQQLDRAYRELINEPLRELMDELLDRFPTPEERERVNAPLIGSGAQ